MKIRRFESHLWLPQPREEIFEFFADPANLEAITPSWLRFRTLTPGPIEMRAGTLIDYQLRVRGFGVRWRTRITSWEPPARFIDEQLRGPYQLWIHEHTFEPENGGTLIRDCVRYAVPFDFLVHELFVRRDVAKIFAYRKEVLLRRFASPLGIDLPGQVVDLD